MPSIKHLIAIEAPASEVYKAITEQAGLAAWWTEETIARPEVGSILEFRFGDEYHDKMRLVNLVPNRKVEWECIEGDERWVGTKFTFDLEEEDGRTVLRFSHYDWARDDDFYALCNTTWASYMQSLKDLCETGTGTPFPLG